MSCYPEAMIRLHVERGLREMIPKQIVCIDLISPVLRNWLDSHTLDLFTTNVFAWRRCSLVKSTLWFDWFNGFQCRTFSRCTVGRKTVGCGTLGRKKFGKYSTHAERFLIKFLFSSVAFIANHLKTFVRQISISLYHQISRCSAYVVYSVFFGHYGRSDIYLSQE